MAQHQKDITTSLRSATDERPSAQSVLNLNSKMTELSIKRRGVKRQGDGTDLA